MIRLNNDYCHAAHPNILKAIAETNLEAYPGYGLDPWCEKARSMIRTKIQQPNAAVHFLVGGTQANYTVVSAALRPWQSVICADSAHLNDHETGAVEHAGFKCETTHAENGKITAQQIGEIAAAYRNSCVQEHITQPKMVYISFATETGTVYSLEELQAIRQVCDEFDLYLFVDGARMGYGLEAIGGNVTAQDMAEIADVFYFGGTKQGALFGEAVVITNDELKPFFRSNIKQNGGMLAKGWLLGLQFATLFENDLYFDLARKANEQAAKISKALIDKGLRLASESNTNQVFVLLSEEQNEALADKFALEDEGMCGPLRKVRVCTSWSTTDEEVSAIVKAIKELPC